MIHVHGKKTNVKRVFHGDKEVSSVQWQGNELLPRWKTLEISDNFIVSPEEPIRWSGYYEVINGAKSSDSLSYEFMSFWAYFIRFSSSFDSSSVRNMSGMFYMCNSLTELDLSSLDTSNVEEMNSMFEGCSSLTELDLSSLDTSNVEGMNSMFKDCSSLTELDLSSLDTSNVEDMNLMFRGCSSLTELDLSSFDTSSLKEMSLMFEGCSSLTEIDLSSFDTSSVEGMDAVFSNCENLRTVYCRTQDDAERLKYTEPQTPVPPGEPDPPGIDFVVK